MRNFLLKSICILAILVHTISSIHAEKRRILFIGNSYTAVNDLPNTVKNIALSLGDTLEVDSYTPGGYTFNNQSTDANTLAKFQLGNWDYVVLQAQSQEPSFSPSQVSTDTYPYAKVLDSLIHVYNPCAETIFYMTWGRKNGDASNCPFYPPICTYDGMQQRLRESYLEMAMDNNASVAPAGVAWRTFRNTYPTTELYQADESHPSLNGTYLVACAFYSSIYHKTTVGSQYLPSGVGNSDAFYMQTIASNTVLDSIENWQQYGNLPHALFSFSNTSNQYSFNNQSLRATIYAWDFGDGSPISNLSNPQHTYTNAGTYTVKLKASNTCGKYDTMEKTFTVQVPNAINEITSLSNDIHYSNSTLYFTNKNNIDKIKIFNINGQSIQSVSISKESESCLIPLPIGQYFYQLFSGKKLIAAGKFVNKN